MGIRFYCPNGHKLNVKEFQAGRRGICPFCGARTQIPTQSTRPSSKDHRRGTNRRASRPFTTMATAGIRLPRRDILPGEPPSLPVDPGYQLAGAGHPLGPQRVGSMMLGPSAAPDASSPGPVECAPATSAAWPQPAATRPPRLPVGGAVLAAPPAPALQPQLPGPCPARPRAQPIPRTAAAAFRAAVRAWPRKPPRRAARSDRRRPGYDLVHSPADRRTVRPRAGRADANLAERRPRQRRLAGLARKAGATGRRPARSFPNFAARSPSDPLDTAIRGRLHATGRQRNGRRHPHRPKHGRSTDRTQ